MVTGSIGHVALVQVCLLQGGQDADGNNVTPDVAGMALVDLGGSALPALSEGQSNDDEAEFRLDGITMA